MLVTLLGIVTEVRSKQAWNAPSPMLVTLQVTPLYNTVSGITMSPLYLLSMFLYKMTVAYFVTIFTSYQSPLISTSSAKALAAADRSITISSNCFFIILYRFLVFYFFVFETHCKCTQLILYTEEKTKKISLFSIKYMGNGGWSQCTV